MIYLVYISSAVKLFSEEELLELLQKARENNTRDNITGLLLYRQGNFIQVIEGDEDKVHALHQKILADARHTNIILLLKRPLKERMFSEWSMGFRNLTGSMGGKLPGFSQFFEDAAQPENLSETADKVYKLLLAFRENMR